MRGLRENVNRREIEEALNTPLARIEQPREINDVICTIVIFQNLSEAERILRNFKNSGLGGRADIHPYSSIFKSPEQSVDLIFAEYRKKRNFLVQSGCMKIFRMAENLSESEDARSLISSVSATVEDGEITDTDAPPSETSQNYYILYEHPGSYINQDREENMHSGVCVKTVLSFPNSMSNF